MFIPPRNIVLLRFNSSILLSLAIFTAAEDRIRIGNQIYMLVFQEQVIAMQITFGFRPNAIFSPSSLEICRKKSFRWGRDPHHEKTENVETAADYRSLVVYGISHDGKFDCRRLQFARNVKIVRTAARKYARNFRAWRGKPGERKVFISTFAKSSSSRRLSLLVLSHHQHHHSASRRLCRSECRKTMPTYESAKEVYELLRVLESALFMTNGNVSQTWHTQIHTYYAIILLRNYKARIFATYKHFDVLANRFLRTL